MQHLRRIFSGKARFLQGGETKDGPETMDLDYQNSWRTVDGRRRKLCDSRFLIFADEGARL